MVLRAVAGASVGSDCTETSPTMQKLWRLVQRVGPSTLAVLVTGETGVGKEIVSRAVHDASGRRGKFVAVNCAALPSTLAESELFGHAKGSFTGAVESRRGYFAEADGGTLLLDEVGEMPLDLQAKLLRVLDGGEVRPVGAAAAVRVDVRIVAATNRDLRQEVVARRFREDLYHRLVGIVLHVPPLRERREEVPALVERFIAESSRAWSFAPRVPSDVLSVLAQRPWPGNVRELRQAVHRAVVLGGGLLNIDDFTVEEEHAPVTRARVDSARWDDIQRTALTTAIAEHGSVRAAARALGLPRSTAYDWARSFGLIAKRARAAQPHHDTTPAAERSP